jgi:protoporphyrinogen oxidase
MRIGILGGGLSGLAVGSFLKDDFLVMEAAGEAGGLCRSVTEEGYTFDTGGSHVIFSKNKETLSLMLGLLAGNATSTRRNSKVFFKKRFVKYPFENGLGQLDASDNLACLSSYLAAAIRNVQGPYPDLKECLVSRFGKGIAYKYLIPYNEKIWNTPAEELSAGWVEGRLPMPPWTDVVKSSLGVPTEGYLHQSVFHYPTTGGISALTKSLEKKCGEKVARKFPVTKVRKEDGKWVVYSSRRQEVFDRLVSTIPVFSLLGCLEDVPAKIRDAAGLLKYNCVATVTLGYPDKYRNDVSWAYFPGDEPFNRLSFPANFSPKNAPQGRFSSLAEITYRPESPTARFSDGKIISETVEALDRDGLVPSNEIEYSRVHRNRYAYIIQDKAHEEARAEVTGYLESIGINLCGRFSQYRYLNMDACVQSALETSKRVSG